jgi:hypothetical protein
MMQRSVTRFFVTIFVLAFFSPDDTVAQITEILPGDGAAEDLFGSSVSISGDYAVIGAYGDEDNGSHSGSTYIFRHEGPSWIEEAKLMASDGAALDYFGTSVSISGDYAVIGAWGDDDNGVLSGSAYIFRQDGTSWMEESKLTASDGAANDWFGYSVSISGDYAVIGAYGDDDNGSYSGSAYIFRREGSSWMEEAKLSASDGAADDLFGYSVSISGDYAVIGVLYDDDNGVNSGSAYIFRREGTSWVEEAKLTASDGAGGDYFGHSVSISGDYAVIGAWGADDNGTDGGAAYVYSGFSAVSVEDPNPASEIPHRFVLEQNYPNPFNPETTIVYKIAGRQSVRLDVYDILGREVATLVNEKKSPGAYEVTWDATGQASGVYLYRLRARQTDGGQAGNFVATKKFLLIR